MYRRISLVSLGLLLWIAGISVPVRGATSRLNGMTIVGHFFTTKVNNGRRFISAKDPKKIRIIVLKLRASVVDETAVIVATDFVLAYRHPNGSEDRAQCAGIGLAPKQGLETYSFGIGPAAYIKVPLGTHNFALLFPIESDVEEFDLYRLGASVPLHYKVGSERPYSVYISTRADPSVTGKMRAAIEKGGYQVTGVSYKLSNRVTGFSIHYRVNAATEARDIAARLTQELGTAPEMKQDDLVTARDIVIWYGKAASSQ